MRIVSLALLLLGLLLMADAAAFEGRYTRSALTTLDHGSKEFGHSVESWSNSGGR